MSGTQLATGGFQRGLSIPLCIHAYAANKKKIESRLFTKAMRKKGGKSSDWLSHDHVILQTLLTN